MQGRLTGSQDNNNAADFLAAQFKRIGLKKIAGIGGYLDSFEVKVDGHLLPTSNVLGVIAGQSDKIIIFCAHYDHVGTEEQLRDYGLLKSHARGTDAADKIFNGANDNASGVAALLALASYYVSGPKPVHTLVFAAFSGEELGLFGAGMVAVAVDEAKVTQVINFEMLGRTNAKTDHRPYVTALEGDQRFLKKLNKHYETATGIKHFFVRDPFKEEQLFARSDNMAFARYNMPSNTIMAASPNDEYYHQPGDEWESLDFEAMEKIVRAIALATRPLVYNAP
jgi:Zn-dependent M28 family amino/carboxypeptidase